LYINITSCEISEKKYKTHTKITYRPPSYVEQSRNRRPYRQGDPKGKPLPAFHMPLNPPSEGGLSTNLSVYKKH